MGQKTDAQLIADARLDAEAFADLYRRHVKRVYVWLRQRAPDVDASELTAETFAQAAVSLKRFRAPDSGSALPWLIGIANNLLKRYYERQRVEDRARRRLGMPARSYEDDPVDRLDERLRAADLSSVLDTALAELPPSQRDALELRVVEELPYEEVASRLDCTELAARLRVMRALRSLKRALPRPFGAGDCEVER